MTVEEAEQFARLGLIPRQKVVSLEIFMQYVDYYGLNSTISHYEKQNYKFDDRVIEYIKQQQEVKL